MEAILAIVGWLYLFGVIALAALGPDELPWPRRLLIGLLWPVWLLMAALIWRHD